MKNCLKSNLFLKEWNPDLLGSGASTLCMLHCVAFPLFSIFKTVPVNCSSVGPWWWHLLDYVFLTIGLIAIRQTQKSTSFKWITYALYGSWILLALFIFNEKFSLLSLSRLMFYFPAFSLVILHLYNLKNCAYSNNL